MASSEPVEAAVSVIEGRLATGTSLSGEPWSAVVGDARVESDATIRTVSITLDVPGDRANDAFQLRAQRDLDFLAWP